MRKLALVLLFVFAASLNAFSNETIKLATGEWAPYTSEKDPNGKIAETIVREAFGLEQIDVTYEYYPWKRSYESAKKGKVAGTFPWFKNEERMKECIYHKEPLLNETEVFFHLKNLDFKWENYKDLGKYKIGGTLGFSHVKELEKEGIKLDVTSREDLNFKKLLAGRIEAYPASLIVGYNTINKLFAPEKAALFTNHTKTLKADQMYLIFSKNIPNGQKLADKFDSGLRRLKASGRYDEIIAACIGTK